MMIFLANENIPFPSIKKLRESGFNVISVYEKFAGFQDEKIIQIAIEHNYIILTLDRDYGELIFRYSSGETPSVIYFRSKGNNPLFIAEKLIQIIQMENTEFENCFTVVEQSALRQRRYVRD